MPKISPAKTTQAPLTPMLKQYHTVKAKHKDCILFFRLGDFYEMFYDDAEKVSRILDLVLTARGKGTANKIPMCGFPHHAADNYIARLIKAGQKVAICEQLEDPTQATGVVKRDVTRIITAGTYLDEHDQNTRLILSLSPNKKHIGVAFTDLTSGTIMTNQYPLNKNNLVDLIAGLSVHECVFPDSSQDMIRPLFELPLLKNSNTTLSPYNDWCFNTDIAKKNLHKHFAVINLHGFGLENHTSAVSAAGALLEYLKTMNKQPLRHIDKITLYTDDNHAYIAPAAYRGLELESVIKTMDHTLTAIGKRTFRQWFYRPLKHKKSILQRQNAIETLNNAPEQQTQIKDILKQIPDIEKNISRLSCGYTHAKDLLAIRNTLNLIPQLIETVTPLKQHNPLFTLDDPQKLREYLSRTINEDIPLSHPEGKVIQKGCHPELDTLKDIQDNGRGWLRDLQAREIKRTGIPSLKIGYNKVFGYYIEITKAHLKNAPSNYIRKQTLTNAERFITPELKEYEDKILTAQDKIIQIEQTIILQVQKQILDHSIQLHQMTQNIAVIDNLYSLSTLAQSPGYIKPTITDKPAIHIREGRHPVVEQISNETFIANDTDLDSEDNHLIILTGPNMAGKSTYIRQSAILVIIAQTGSYIPAAKAEIGIVDKFFTRIGAHDDISKGQSTFMVEMNETAGILNNLTDRSLVILDEIGRGTSTYDGLSLAWALALHLHKTKAMTLFATHFHELTALADQYNGIKNYNVAVKEWKDEIIFLHKIIPGSSDDSYGIYVAKLAGIPATVINQAKIILTRLELKQDLKENLKGDTAAQNQIDFLTPTPETADPVAQAIKQDLQQLDINTLSPLDALNQLHQWKGQLTHES